uniref:cytochrome c oxidase subunit II n=1 Tax=Leucoptera coffeella TaxID=1178041 RepID=UPI002E79DA32|nr:cytochrome c oxidase subunit II [Leucoptera coffeella]WPR14286.1 cytochrome c oxidase subunit II [Leucoptera coffeella]
MATWSNLKLQDSASPIMEQIDFIHDHALIILSMITVLVGYIMSYILINKFTNRYILDNQLIELIWTVIPAITLIFIAFPSLRLLYLMEEINNPFLTIKSIGNQWYWSYEYSDFNNIEFDSYMIPTNDLSENSFRLLDVDNRIVLPMNNHIRFMVTASDVLHSWTIPAIGVKMDANPGRLNQTSFFLKRPGIFYGQCSEICGANHSFMPIVMESIPTMSFINWIKKN